jgi:hypothetical protein
VKANRMLKEIMAVYNIMLYWMLKPGIRWGNTSPAKQPYITAIAKHIIASVSVLSVILEVTAIITILMDSITKAGILAIKVTGRVSRIIKGTGDSFSGRK